MREGIKREARQREGSMTISTHTTAIFHNSRHILPEEPGSFDAERGDPGQQEGW